MKIDYKAKFCILVREHGAEVGTIRYRITRRGCRPFDISTGYRVNTSEWNAMQQRLAPSAANARAINTLLDEWRAVFSEIVARYELIEKRVPSVEEFRELFNQMVGRPSRMASQLKASAPLAVDVLNRFISAVSVKNMWSDSTFEKFVTIRHHLERFDASLCIDEITDAKLQTYVTYLLNVAQLRNTTIVKHLSFVRWFLRWAANEGLYNGKSHITFKPRLKGTDGNAKEIIYLTRDELQRVETFVFPRHAKALERVRDVFVFCCYSGLRYSDVAKLKRTDVKGDYINVVTQKTADGLRIELNKHTRAILAKYADVTFPRGRALPIISNQKMNEMLKVLGSVVGIDTPTRIVWFHGSERHEQVFPKYELLTTHCGRRTFVVMALLLGISSEVIMKWTGHSDIKAMRPYMAIVDELKAQSMARFDTL